MVVISYQLDRYWPRYRNSKNLKFLTKKIGQKLTKTYENLRKFTKIYESLRKFTQITKVYGGYVILRKFTPEKIS